MWYINYFHLQILALELLLCMKIPGRKLFWLRLIPAAALYCALPALVPGGFFAPFLVTGWFTFGFMAAMVLSGLLLGLSFRMNVRQVVFYCCVAHTIQHMVHCLYRLNEMALSLSYNAAQSLQLLFMAVACLLVWRYLREPFRGSETADMNRGQLVWFASISTLIIYVISYWTTSRETETIGLTIFDLFACALLLVILLDVFRLRRAERDQMIMMRLLRQEQEQHELSRATIDVINRKCHDLRHQIAALRHMSAPEQEKSIAELEDAVLIYDRFPKSGNEDVDIILAEKGLLAEKKGIAIRGIVDGEKLKFMGIEDLYSLLGNALDNAIEAAGKEEDPSRRIITLHAAAKGALFAIHIENPSSRQPMFMDGLPVTDKQDTDFHGFGMRSMRYICEKYSGALTTGWEDGIFSVDMLFPLGEDAPA